MKRQVEVHQFLVYNFERDFLRTSISEAGKCAIWISRPLRVNKLTRIGSAVSERSTIQRFFLALVMAT
jgi:hypothetical protein